MKSIKKPVLPPNLRAINNLMGCYYVVHGLTLWLGSAAAGYAVWRFMEGSLLVKLPLLLLCAVVSGFGMFFMALLGHEGFHGNLHRNRDVSMAMGILASAIAPMFVSTGYNVMHWQHHLHTNTLKDPDYLLYRENRSFLARLTKGPMLTAMQCVRNALMLTFTPERLERSFPFSLQKARFFAVFNLLLMIGALAGYAMLALHADPAVFVFVVVLPVAFSQTYWSFAPYIEHAGTGVGEGVDTRTVTSGVLKFLLCGYNFHLCHHMYPRVQLHKLPAVYLYLKASGYLDGKEVVETSMVKALTIGANGILDFTHSEIAQA
jgi:fatty acid desaturase